jgi:ribonuclease E
LAQNSVIVEGEGRVPHGQGFHEMIMPSRQERDKLQRTDAAVCASPDQPPVGRNFNPTVQLPSGGYIVIDTTEALVASVNSGRAAKVRSNKRQQRPTLRPRQSRASVYSARDLLLIVIDFIDMDRRKNNALSKVDEDKLKTDRARIGDGFQLWPDGNVTPAFASGHVGINSPVHIVHGTGLLRSDDNVAGYPAPAGRRRRGRSKEVLITSIVIANWR